MRKWLKIVEELFKSKVNQDAIAAFTKKKRYYQASYRRLKLSHLKNHCCQKVGSGTAYYQGLRSASVLCERPDPIGLSHVVNILDPAKLRPIDRIARVGLEISSSLPVDSAGNISRTIGHHSIRKLLLSSCVLSNA